MKTMHQRLCGHPLNQELCILWKQWSTTFRAYEHGLLYRCAALASLHSSLTLREEVSSQVSLMRFEDMLHHSFHSICCFYNLQTVWTSGFCHFLHITSFPFFCASSGGFLLHPPSQLSSASTGVQGSSCPSSDNLCRRGLYKLIGFSRLSEEDI